MLVLSLHPGTYGGNVKYLPGWYNIPDQAHFSVHVHNTPYTWKSILGIHWYREPSAGGVVFTCIYGLSCWRRDPTPRYEHVCACRNGFRLHYHHYRVFEFFRPVAKIFVVVIGDTEGISALLIVSNTNLEFLAVRGKSVSPHYYVNFFRVCVPLSSCHLLHHVLFFVETTNNFSLYAFHSQSLIDSLEQQYYVDLVTFRAPMQQMTTKTKFLFSRYL